MVDAKRVIFSILTAGTFSLAWLCYFHLQQPDKSIEEQDYFKILASFCKSIVSTVFSLISC